MTQHPTQPIQQKDVNRYKRQPPIHLPQFRTHLRVIRQKLRIFVFVYVMCVLNSYGHGLFFMVYEFSGSNTVPDSAHFAPLFICVAKFLFMNFT